MQTPRSYTIILVVLCCSLSLFAVVGSKINLTLGTTPGNAAAGKVTLWANATTGNVECINAAGTSCLASVGNGTGTVNVESFGASSNGSLDNTSAINSAIASMHAGQTLFFPCTAGDTYTVASPINFASMQKMAIQGSGPGCKIAYNSSLTAQPYAFSFVGAWMLNISNISFWSTPYGVSPKVALLLGRPISNVASGSFNFVNVTVEGYATTALVYSIASEENYWTSPQILLNGGGARVAFYTSSSDDLSVNSLPTSSNLSTWMQAFHIQDFTSYADATNVLIKDVGNSSGAGNHTYRDGYLASASGIGFSFVSTGSGSIQWMGNTIDSNRFEGGTQMFQFSGAGAFGDIAITNNKSAGVTGFMINLPTTCYDCTFWGNNVQQGDTAVSSVGTLRNSQVSENYPFTVGTLVGSQVYNRVTGSTQMSEIAIASLPTCNSAAQGMSMNINNGVTSPTYNATVSTTGSVHIPVYCNGTNWVYH